jgi:deazaflavin-dependent oxidoreductase (nitroreductase family)
MWEHNAGIIEAFRKHGGRIPSDLHPVLAETDMVLLTIKGAKSGREYVIPLVSFSLGEDFFVVASAGGSPKPPSWYYNLKQNPQVVAERGAEKYAAIATLVEEEAERARLYSKTVEVQESFAGFEKKAGRTIPVFIVRRAEG